MQVSVESTSELGRKVTISVPADIIEPEVEKRLQKLSSTAEIKGFRKGKAPLSFIKKNYSKSVRFEIMDEKIREFLTKALEEKKLTPASQPQIDLVNIQEGAPFEFSASFEIFPEIHLKDLSGVTIEKNTPNITHPDL